MKKTLFIVIGVFAGLLILTNVFLLWTRLDTTVPTVKFKFISSDASKEQQVEYSFCYEGDNMIGGSKFGGYGCSEIKTATTGQVIEIPSKRIVSYLPASHFTYLLINAEKKDMKQGDCTWTVSYWSKDGLASLTNDAQEDILKNGASHNEYRLEDIQNKVIEVTCL